MAFSSSEIRYESEIDVAAWEEDEESSPLHNTCTTQNGEGGSSGGKGASWGRSLMGGDNTERRY